MNGHLTLGCILSILILITGCHRRTIELHVEGRMAAHSTNPETASIADTRQGMSHDVIFTYISLMLGVSAAVGIDDLPIIKLYPTKEVRRTVYLPLQLQGKIPAPAGQAGELERVILFTGPVNVSVNQGQELGISIVRNEPANAGPAIYEVTAIARKR